MKVTAMPELVGRTLGHYVIAEMIGAGGMGEVYRATDTRLDREVAVKVLPDEVAQSADRLARFEREAKAIAQLSHPNILGIYDYGREGETTYAVTELLEGETLRDRLDRGPLGWRAASEIAASMADGLAAAHRAGIVHRDVKPSNVFLTADGRVKLLDFGLARQTSVRVGDSAAEAPTASPDTEPGTVLGTVGYMSPEQVRGESADSRSDVFSLGVVVYEMLSGERPFERRSSVETMNAILSDDPPECARPDATLPQALVQLVSHCLEKNAEARFQSAKDIAFALRTLSGLSSPSLTGAVAAGTGRKAARSTLVATSIVAVLVLGTASAVMFHLGRRTGKAVVQPTYQRLTFRRGWVDTARFMPDGQTVVYSAAWDGGASDVFSVRLDRPESRSLGYSDAALLAVSSSSEIGLLAHPSHTSARPGSFWRFGVLAVASFSGGSPKEVLDGVSFADWAPDGKSMAVVRGTESGCQLEYPSGEVVSRTEGALSHPRVSPTGEMVAYLSHPLAMDSAGSVEVLDASGETSTVAGPFTAGVEGLAWSPSGDEVWFTVVTSGEQFGHSVLAATLSGRQRLVLTQPQMIRIHDMARDGRALITSERFQLSLYFYGLPDAAPRQLSWLDSSVVNDLSPDGRTLLFVETPGVGGNTPYWFYLRNTDGSPPVKIHQGAIGWMSFSPDGQRIVISQLDPPAILVCPIGPGKPSVIELPGLTVESAKILADGKSVLFIGRETSRPARLWLTDVSGATPRPVTPEGLTGEVTPDGKSVLHEGSFYPLGGGAPTPVQGMIAGDAFAGWGSGASMFVWRPSGLPLQVLKIDLKTGRRELVRQFLPPDLAGYQEGSGILRVSADGTSFAFSSWQRLAELYLVEGLE